ncbi:MAG TPA: Fic family protein [Solirubrobacteraceae bacterium]|nr:Fic family protein [Solirubrobacteraceae bacterium]
MEEFPPGDVLVIAAAVLETTPEELLSRTRMDAVAAAVQAPFVTLNGKMLFPHPVERAAVLAERIVLNRPFPAGNDRVALICLTMTLESASYRLTASEDQTVEMFRRLGGRGERLAEEDFRAWVRENVERLNP